MMSVSAIEDHINQNKQTPYEPSSLPKDDLTLDQKGTRIVLTGLKKRVAQAPAALRKRLARRFSVIGTNDFNVKINGKSVTITDRNYFHKIQYLWHFGDGSEEYVELCERRNTHQLENVEVRDGKIKEVNEDGSIDKIGSVKGWIGTVLKPERS